MGNVLSRVERVIVIKYLQEKLPKLLIKAIATEYIPSEQNAPKFLPIDIEENNYSILDQGIVFITRSQLSRIIIDKAKICVFFYYNGRGLFFESTLRHVKNGFAIVIPEFIFKQDDVGNGILQQIKCNIYNSEDKTEGKITCVPTEKFRLFSSADESQIPIQFFSEDLTAQMPSVEGRILPPFILYISENEIYIGSVTTKINFQIEETYTLELQIPFAFIFRTINCKIILKDKYKSENSTEKTCYRFEFSSLKHEDYRFLFEKNNGKKIE